MSLSELLRIKREWMAALEAREAGALTRMIDSYAEIATALAAQAEGAWLDIERKRAAGEAVTQSALFQEARIRALLLQAQQQFTEWADTAAIETDALRVSAVRIAGDAVRSELSYLTTPPGQSSSVVGAFDVLPVDAINELLAVLVPGSPVAGLFAALPPSISAEIRKALVVGLAAGENPRAVGRRMTKASGGGLAGGIRIARTEMMRAYRAAHHANYQRNSDVVKGWIWLSARNSRTCAGCLAMHGTFHPLEETLDDHPNGRCTPLPVTKTWAELGYGNRGWQETSVGEEGVESGEDWFAAQPLDVWEKVLGKAGAGAYISGRVKLVDFAGIQKSPIWGNSIYQRSLADALKAAEARKRSEENNRRRAQRAARAAQATSTTAAAGVTPAGVPVSRALSPNPDIKELVDDVAAAIDKVHGDGALPTLPIRYAINWLDRMPAGVYGAYRRTQRDVPHDILMNKRYGGKRMTLAHELGHFIDHAGLGQVGVQRFGSETELMNAWRRAVFSTPTVQTLEQHRDNMLRQLSTTIQTPAGPRQVFISVRFLDYLLSDKELFARSYAQYIAVRSGDKAMLRELRRDQKRVDMDKGIYFSNQWQDDEFEVIAKAFDEAFRQLGWMN
jgi:SPP1 gp7 family putative phage head morphogenesis protein